jgi:hypothetical protein
MLSGDMKEDDAQEESIWENTVHSFICSTNHFLKSKFSTVERVFVSDVSVNR